MLETVISAFRQIVGDNHTLTDPSSLRRYHARTIPEQRQIPAVVRPSSVEEIQQLWSRITCPTLLAYGKESWASNPQEDGRARHFQNARVVIFEGAGHWVHHDRLDAFIDTVRKFLA